MGPRTLFALSLFALNLVSASPAQAAQPEPVALDPDELVAILDVQLEDGVPATLRLPFTDSLVEAILDRQQLRVIDRAHRDSILAEQSFQLSDCASEDCRVEVGQLLGVGLLIASTVSRVEARYFASAQLISVETGEVRATATTSCDCGAADVPDLTVTLAGDLLGLPVPESEAETETGSEAESESGSERRAEPAPAAAARPDARYRQLSLGRAERASYLQSGLTLEAWMDRELENARGVHRASYVVGTLGVATVVTGLAMVLLADDKTCDGSDQSAALTCEEDRDNLQAAGLWTAAIGGVVVVGGIGMNAYSSRAVRRLEKEKLQLGLAPTRGGATLAMKLRF